MSKFILPDDELITSDTCCDAKKFELDGDVCDSQMVPLVRVPGNPPIETTWVPLCKTLTYDPVVPLIGVARLILRLPPMRWVEAPVCGGCGVMLILAVATSEVGAVC